MASSAILLILLTSAITISVTTTDEISNIDCVFKKNQICGWNFYGKYHFVNKGVYFSKQTSIESPEIKSNHLKRCLKISSSSTSPSSKIYIKLKSSSGINTVYTNSGRKIPKSGVEIDITQTGNFRIDIELKSIRISSVKMSEQDCKDESHILGTSTTRLELQTFSTSETPKVEITKVDCTFKKDHICGWELTGNYHFVKRGVYTSSKPATIKSPEIKSNQLERCLTVALSNISTRSQIFIRLINTKMEYVVYKNFGRNVPKTGVKVDLSQFGNFKIKITIKNIKIASVSLSDLNCQNERHSLETVTNQFEHTTELTKSSPNTSTKHIKFAFTTSETPKVQSTKVDCTFKKDQICGWEFTGKYYFVKRGVYISSKPATIKSPEIKSNQLERCLTVALSSISTRSQIFIRLINTKMEYVVYKNFGRNVPKTGIKVDLSQFGNFKIKITIKNIKISSVSLSELNCQNERHSLETATTQFEHTTEWTNSSPNTSTKHTKFGTELTNSSPNTSTNHTKFAFTTSETPKVELTKVDCTFKKDQICRWEFSGKYYFVKRGVYISSKPATIKSPEIKSNQLERCLTVAFSSISSKSQIFIRIINTKVEYVVYKNSGRNVPKTGVKVDITQFGNFKIKIAMKSIKISSVSLSELNCQNERHILETATTQIEHTTELTKSSPNTSTKHTKFATELTKSSSTTSKKHTKFAFTTSETPKVELTKVDCIFKKDQICGWEFTGKYFFVKRGVYISSKPATVISPEIKSNQLERCLTVAFSSISSKSQIFIRLINTKMEYVVYKNSGRNIPKTEVKVDITQFGNFKIKIAMKSIKISSVSLSELNCQNERNILETATTEFEHTTELTKSSPTTSTKHTNFETESTKDYHPATQPSPSPSTVNIDCFFKKNQLCDWKMKGIHYGSKKGIYFSNVATLESPTIVSNKYERCLEISTSSSDKRSFISIKIKTSTGIKYISKSTGRKRNFIVKSDIDEFGSFKIIFKVSRINIFSISFSDLNCKHQRRILGASTSQSSIMTTALNEEFSTNSTTKSVDLTTKSTTDYQPSTELTSTTGSALTDEIPTSSTTKYVDLTTKSTTYYQQTTEATSTKLNTDPATTSASSISARPSTTTSIIKSISTTLSTKIVPETKSKTDYQPSTKSSSITAHKSTTYYQQTTEATSTTLNTDPASTSASSISARPSTTTSIVKPILTTLSTKIVPETKSTTYYQPSTKPSSTTDAVSTSASSLPARPSTTVTLIKTSQLPKNVTSFVSSTSHPTENKETIKSTNTLPESKGTTVLNTTMQKSVTDASSSPTNATMKQVSTTPNLLKFTTSVTKQHYTTIKETSYMTDKNTENSHTKETIVTSKQRSTNSKFIPSTEANNLPVTNKNNQNVEKSASSDTSKNLHLGNGGIAGIVVGVVALLVIIVFVANYVHRQRNIRKLRNQLYIEDKLRFENPIFEHMEDDEDLDDGPFGVSKA